MTTSYLERLLGLPVEVVAPDYVQLLGLPPDDDDVHDEAEVTAALADRLDRLATAPVDDRPVVEHLRRELQRARATLLDPGGRARHHAEVARRRRQDLTALVTGQLGPSRTLPAAAEQALLEAGRGWGLTADEVRGVVDAALAARGATRAEGGSPSLPALHAARERLRRAMVELADERLRAEAGVRPSDAPVVQRRRSTPPRPAPALVTEDDAPAAADDAEAGAAGHWSAPSAAATGLAPAPVATSATADVTDDRATPWPTIVRGEERARLERRSRRLQRTCLALAALAAAFVAGDLLAAFAPVEAAWVDARTAPARAALLASPRLAELTGGAAGIVAVLSALLVWLAGREARRPFLVPLALLAAPVAYAGLLPVGHERALRGERDGLVAQRDAVAAQARVLVVARDEAQRREAAALADVTSLGAALAALRAEAAERAEREEKLERWVRRYAADRRAQQVTIGRLRDEVAGLEQEVADLRSATAAATAPEPTGTVSR